MPSSAPIRPDTTRARYETLLEVAESIAAHRQLATLFEDLHRCLKRLVSFGFISLTLLDPKERTPRLHILPTDPPISATNRAPIPFDQTPTGTALETRKPYYVADIAEEHRYPIIREILQANRIQSFCVLPLYTALRDIGGLHFGSFEENRYSPED